MNPYASGTGWCELWMRKVWKDVEITRSTPSGLYHPSATTREKQRGCRYELGNGLLAFYDAQWQHKLEFDYQCRITPHNFSYRSHGQGRYDTGGHNWYRTTRFDVWFTNPFDGHQWCGALITGGDNSTFRVRRTKILTAAVDVAEREFFPEHWEKQRNKPTYARRRFVRRPRIEHVDLGEDQFVLRVLDGDIERFYVKAFADGWHIGRTIGDVFASRLCRRQAA